MSDSIQETIQLIQSQLAKMADPDKAAPMAAYMKTDQPFYGVQKAGRTELFRQLKRRINIAEQQDYEDLVTAVWQLPHREEQYTAIFIASHFKTFHVPASFGLYEQMIREGAWWDLVDAIATQLVGQTYRHHPDEIRPILDTWIEDEDMWIRRTAILSQLKHKTHTDEEQLFDYCLRCIEEKEFFIRKAIGWVLREYSKTSPASVYDFLCKHRDTLSGLSFREGSKKLKQQGYSFD